MLHYGIIIAIHRTRGKSIFADSIPSRRKGLRAAGEGQNSGSCFSREIPAEVHNQISLMKRGNHIKPSGAEKKDIRVLFS